MVETRSTCPRAGPAGDARGPARVAALAALAALGLASCVVEAGDAASDDGPGSARRPIVGGTPESGYQGVGALVIDYGGSFGHFCTGTLVADEWVLTAAHCLDDDAIDPYMVSFFVGADATRRSGGTLYDADSFHPHPAYGPGGLANDIALVHLMDRAAGVTTYAYNTTALSWSDVGRAITWIGYGINDAAGETGGGIKRRAAGNIAEVYSTAFDYAASPSGALPCRGDSGGPTFATIGGGERIVGVVSSGDTSCASFGIDTRVDAFASWIASAMAAGGGHTNCAVTGGSCGPQACWLVDDGVYACLPSDGRRLAQSCNPDSAAWGDTLPCADGLLCMLEWPGADTGRCVSFCGAGVPCAAGTVCEAPVFTGVPDVGACMPTCDLAGRECGASRACLPDDDDVPICYPSDGLGVGATCDPAAAPGEDVPCADGLACVRTGGLHVGVCTTLCRDDSGCVATDRCEIPFFPHIPDVGLCVCRDADSDGWCAAGDCNDEDGSANPDAAEVCGDGIDNNCRDGVDESCGCTDADGDGYCQAEDCDDSIAAIHPGAAEVCGDGIDNNCRDGVDETCGCTDADGDGYCEADDCDDGNATVSPAGVEACDDGLDNNCNDLFDLDDPACDGGVPPAGDGDSGCACSASGGASGGAGVALLLCLAGLARSIPRFRSRP